MNAQAAPLTVLLPLRIDRARRVSDLDRFAALGLPSLVRQLDPALVAELIVVSPARDVEVIRSRLRGRLPYRMRVLDERTVAPGADSTPGWVKQQILKLAAAQLVQTPWYLTLDADVVATRPLTAEMLLPGGRAVWKRESVAAHPEWWAASARMLGCEAVPRERPVFGVTPALLRTTAVRTMLDRLAARRADGSWIAALAAKDGGWTEYSLYWTYCIDTGSAEEYYSVSTELELYSSRHSVWTADDLSGAAARVEEAFEDEHRAAFFVFQSNIETPLTDLLGLLGPYVRGHGPTLLERLQAVRHRAEGVVARLTRGIRVRMRRGRRS